MRLVPVLALAALAFPSFAEEAAKPAAGTAINTICPVGGEKIDATVAPVAAKTTDGKEVLIGTCCAGCDKAIAKDPTGYADAAVANRKYEKKADAAKPAEKAAESK